MLIYLHEVASDGTFAFPNVLAGKYWGFEDVESRTTGKKLLTRKIQVMVDKKVTDLHLVLIPE